MIDLLKRLFGIKTVDFKKLVEEGAMIIDVRTPQEFKSGNVKGSVNIPVDQIPAKAKQIAAKNKVVIAYCRSGMRSKLATNTLKGMGVEAYNGGSLHAMQSRLA